MPFKKGASGNPNGATAGKKRTDRGTAGMKKAASWAWAHMDATPGEEGKAPPGGLAMLKEAREAPSRFLDRAERLLERAKGKSPAGDEPARPEDVHFGEVIDRLLEEFASAQSGTVGGGGPAGPVGKPPLPPVRQGEGAAGQGAAAASA